MAAAVEDVEDSEIVLEDTFNRAAEFVQKEVTSGNKSNVTQDVMLQIYGLYKTSTIGKCVDPKPGIFDPRGRAKWNAWVNSSKLSKEMAMVSYIKLVAENYHWNPASSHEEGNGNSSGLGGNSVSSFAVPQEDDDTEECSNNIIFRWIKENDMQNVKCWIAQGNDVNFQDNDGLSLLHWAVDRGHIDLTKLLLKNEADATIRDTEGLTSLDYAVTCEHDSIVILLQSHLTS